jgi:hypothetical protein
VSRRRGLFYATVALLAGAAVVHWLRREAPPREVAAPAPPTAPEAAEMPVAPPSAAALATPAAVPALAGGADRARTLALRLGELLSAGRPLSEEEEAEVRAIEAELLALGEAGAAPLIELTDAAGGSARERLFNVLRRLPGRAVEDRLVKEAREGTQDSMRTMAIESLAARRTERALDALTLVARTDPRLPARPLITSPRDPNDPSIELPDEEVFTPRMQAMTALASTGDPRVVPVLADLVRTGADESLRMEAARNLQGLRADPRASETLRAAAANDPSPYVRLAALHSLDGADDPSLAPVLESIATHDRDAGVRALAMQVLARLRR